MTKEAHLRSLVKRTMKAMRPLSDLDIKASLATSQMLQRQGFSKAGQGDKQAVSSCLQYFSLLESVMSQPAEKKPLGPNVPWGPEGC